MYIFKFKKQQVGMQTNKMVVLVISIVLKIKKIGKKKNQSLGHTIGWITILDGEVNILDAFILIVIIIHCLQK